MLAFRPAAVAGISSAADSAGLRPQATRCVAGSGAGANAPAPKLLIVPHAGGACSGPTAGRAYARLARCAAGIRRVVLLGPAHRWANTAIAMPTVDAFESPRGHVSLDIEARAALAGLNEVRSDNCIHMFKRSLDIQLPFLQAALGDAFRLLPLAVGHASPHAVAAVIERLWGGDETVFVISTNLSHALPYQDACLTDRMTASRLVDLATDFDPFEACGAHILNGAMLAARQHGLRAELLDLCNSGDTGGHRRQVVGYAALALSEPLVAELLAGCDGSEDHRHGNAALLRHRDCTDARPDPARRRQFTRLPGAGPHQP